MSEEENIMKSFTERYAWRSEREVISFFVSYVAKTNLINLGKAGMSKSHCTSTLAETLTLPDVVTAVGHKSPMNLFEYMCRNKDKHIIFDEGASILLSPEAISSLLLPALFGEKKISWQDQSCDFEGNIVINTNSLPKNQNIKALEDRCITNRIYFSPQDLFVKWIMSQNDKNKLSETEISHVRDTLIEGRRLGLEGLPELDEVDKQAIYSWIGKGIASMRVPTRLFTIARVLKYLYGDIIYIGLFIKTPDILEQIATSTLARRDKIKEIATAKGCTTRHALRLLKDYETDICPTIS